jgi:hypothetical protein
MILDKKVFIEKKSYMGDNIWLFTLDGKTYLYSDMILKKINTRATLSKAVTINNTELVKMMGLFNSTEVNLAAITNNKLKLDVAGASGYIPVLVNDNVPESIIHRIEVYNTAESLELPFIAMQNYLDIRKDITSAIALINKEDKAYMVVNNSQTFYAVEITENKPTDMIIDFNLIRGITTEKGLESISILYSDDIIMMEHGDSVIYQGNGSNLTDSRRKLINNYMDYHFPASNVIMTTGKKLETNLPSYSDGMVLYIYEGKLRLKNFDIVIEYELDINLEITYNKPIQVTYDFAHMLTKFENTEIHIKVINKAVSAIMIKTPEVFVTTFIPTIQGVEL